MQEYWDEKNKRIHQFCKTNILKSLMSEQVVIDDTHRLFFIGKKELDPTKIIYSFDEVSGYEFEEVGGKTVTKSKGGIGRAVIGCALLGPVGAIVGASTSKTETKKVGAIKLLKVQFNTNTGKSTRVLSSPPDGLTAFLDKCIENQSSTVQENLAATSTVDEIRKFKELLDESVSLKSG